MAVKNKQASALARLRNQAREEGINYQTCLQLFVQEEFLRRLSHSKYRDNLILKGGMFLYTLTNFDSRPTQDIDFLMKRLSNDLANIKSVMQEICNVQTENDFIELEVLGTEQITLWKKYPGVKTKLLGRMGNVRVPFSIDIGIDDVIVPEPELRSIATRLDGFESPRIYTYSLESTVAEKFDAIIQRMETTSRMKDFYDIYYLAETFDFEGALLRKAIVETMEHRGRTLEKGIFDRIEQYDQNSYLQIQWKAFDPVKETGLQFRKVLDVLIAFLRPVADSITAAEEITAYWNCSAGKWVAMPDSTENIRKDSHLTDSLTGVLTGDDDPEEAKEDALKEKYGKMD